VPIQEGGRILFRSIPDVTASIEAADYVIYSSRLALMTPLSVVMNRWSIGGTRLTGPGNVALVRAKNFRIDDDIAMKCRAAAQL
jgi:hypothetical protein